MDHKLDAELCCCDISDGEEPPLCLDCRYQPIRYLCCKLKGRAALCPQTDGDKLPQLERHAHRCRSVVIVNESY